MPDSQERELMDALGKTFNALDDLLAKRNTQIEKLEREKREEINKLLGEIERLKREYLDSEKENQEVLAEFEERFNKLAKEIEILTSTPPIPVGKLVSPTKDGWVLIFDNHRALYEVPLSPDIAPQDLEEGSEVHYTIDITGKPLGVFAVRKIRREEEIVLIKAVVDEQTALAVLSGDVIKLVNVAQKLQGNLEKGDEVYYDQTINYITDKVPKTEEKIDLRHVQKKNWEDIGGLREQVRKIKEVAELPLKHPELFGELGISCPRGILLTGPPGVGKTLIGRVLANETEAFFIHISGPEIISSYVGESEARLRALFETARKNAPAILFLDEIEAISEKRDEAEHGHERRLVSQLLALMDGLTSSEQVIVIAATNKPNLLDEALRRPGRFDREIEIPIPDETGRLEILKIHSKSMPLAADVSLENLAKVTHGFTGADLEGLCREAGMRVLKGIDFSKIDSSPLNLKVTAEHFNSVLQEIKPSSMREVVFLKPSETWADVGGLEDIKRTLEEAVKWPLLYPELLKQANQAPIRGVLLYGPPGCGKTLVAKALANECGVNFIPVKGPELLNKYIGESESNVRKVFKRARQSAPCIIFFDEIDALVSMRGMHSGDAGVSDKVTAQLLTEMDGIEPLKGVFLLAATNRIDLVDPALLRPGRFDYLLYLPPPGEEARLKIFEIHTKGRPLAEDVDLKTLSKRAVLPKGTEILINGVPFPLKSDLPFSGNAIQSICQKAGQKALREFVDNHDPKNDYCNFKIYMKHFDEALGEILPSVRASAQEEGTVLDREEKEPFKVKQFTDEDIDNMA